MSENLEQMNLERARKIIESRVFGEDFNTALQFLKLHDPDNPLLNEFDNIAGNEQQSQEKDEAEKINKTVDKALDAMRQDKNERDILGEEKHDLTADDDILANQKSIASIYDDDSFKLYLSVLANRDTVHIGVDDNGNILGKGENKTNTQLVEENKLRKEILNESLEAAKQEVLMFFGRDKTFAEYSSEQKRDILKNSISDVFNFKMAKSVAASAVKEATPEQATPETEASKSYQEQALTDMRNALEAFYTKKTVTVKPSQILNSAVHTSRAMDEYEADLRKEQLNKSADLFNQKKEDYNQKRRSFWGKAFDMAKGVWQGIKQNKARIITDAAVVAGAGLAATAAPFVAAAGMAAYFAVSSYAWLVNDERRNQKAKSDDKTSWTGLKGMKNAWKAIMSDEKKKSKFVRQGTITATAGVAGAGIFGVAASSFGLAAGRVASGVARALGSVTNQGTNWALAAKEYKKDASEENKAARDSAKTGFYVSAAAAVLANAVSAYFGLSHDAAAPEAAHTAEANPTAETTPVPETTPAPETATETTPEAKAVSEVAPAPEPVAEPVVVPTEWNENMGISEAHWNEMHDKITGIYKEHAAIFGKENVDPQEAMKNMYQNLENARSAGYFEGQTNEEVLYKYMKLIEQTERAEVLKGTNYLVTKLGADGQPMYWHNAEEMAALNKIIICNEKVEIAADKIGNTLALINNKGAYTGEGANIGVTNNHYVGGRYNCDEYQNAWEKGAFAHKHPHSIPAKEPTVEPIKEAEPANVDETTIDTAKKPDEKLVTWKETKYTTGDNTVDSGTGNHAAKVVKEGLAPEKAARLAMQKNGLVNG